MADPVTFTPNVPVVTQAPSVTVAGTLVPGRYLFRLVVTDDVGIASLPVTLAVQVQSPIVPPIPIPIPPVPILG